MNHDEERHVGGGDGAEEPGNGEFGGSSQPSAPGAGREIPPGSSQGQQEGPGGGRGGDAHPGPPGKGRGDVPPPPARPS